MTTDPLPHDAPTVATLTVVESPPLELVEVAKKSQLEPITAEHLLDAYKPYFTEIRRLIADAKKVNVTDATQVTLIKKARELRLALAKQRIAADKTREALKLDSKRKGDAIQGMFNVLKFMTEPMEEQLLAAEEFAVRAEAKRKEALKAERAELLRPFVDPQFYPLGDMEEEEFQKMLAGFRHAKEVADAAKKKADEEKAAKEKAEADERERVRQENEQLKKEAEGREAERLRKLNLHNERVQEATKRSLTLPPGNYGELSEGDFSALLTHLKAEAEEREAEALTRKKLEAERAVAEKRREDAQKEHDRKMKEAQEKTDREIADIRRKNDERAAADKKRRDEEAAEEKRKRDEDAAAHQKRVDEKLEEMRRKANADAAAKKKLEDEIEARRVEDDRRKAEQAEKERLAAAAPFAERLKVFADQLAAPRLPDEAVHKELATKIEAQRSKLVKWIYEKATELLAAKNPTLPL